MLKWRKKLVPEYFSEEKLVRWSVNHMIGDTVIHRTISDHTKMENLVGITTHTLLHRNNSSRKTFGFFPTET